MCYWRMRQRTGHLVVPESLAASPMFAKLVVEGAATEAPPARATFEVEIAVGDFVIRAGANADRSQKASGRIASLMSHRDREH